MKIKLVQTSFSQKTDALALAKSLIEKKYAACVHLIGPVKSIYRWEEKIEETDEFLLNIKTTEERVEAVQAEIRRTHSFQVPEIIVMDISGGLPDYLDWVRQETKSV